MRRLFWRLCWKIEAWYYRWKYRHYKPSPSIPYPEMVKILEDNWRQPILDSLQEPSAFIKAMEKNEQEAVKQVL